jgi:hypothetical protein
VSDAVTTRVRPSQVWYVVALVPFLLSLIPAYALGKAAADEVDVHLETLTDPEVEIGGDDRGLYTKSRKLSQRASCRLRSATGQTARLDDTVEHLSTEHDGATWYRLAPLPSDIDDGTYALRCRVDGSRVDPTELAVSSSPRWGRFALLLLAAFVIPVAAAVLGTLIAVIIFTMRRRGQRADDMDADAYMDPDADMDADADGDPDSDRDRLDADTDADQVDE